MVCSVYVPYGSRYMCMGQQHGGHSHHPPRQNIHIPTIWSQRMHLEKKTSYLSTDLEISSVRSSWLGSWECYYTFIRQTNTDGLLTSSVCKKMSMSQTFRLSGLIGDYGSSIWDWVARVLRKLGSGECPHCLDMHCLWYIDYLNYECGNLVNELNS